MSAARAVKAADLDRKRGIEMLMTTTEERGAKTRRTVQNGKGAACCALPDALPPRLRQQIPQAPILCSFFDSETSLAIDCDGIGASGCSELRFRSKREKDDFRSTFCAGNCALCALVKIRESQ